MTFRIDYENRIQKYLKKAISLILTDVSKNSLPGNHHFYISFNSQFPGVEMSDWLFEKFPKEMTIVIQHSFKELKVTDENLSIILYFNNTPEKMIIPFDSIVNFSDPSVNFSLQFVPLEKDKIPHIPNLHVQKKNDDSLETTESVKKIEDRAPFIEKDSVKTIKNNIIEFEKFKKSD